MASEESVDELVAILDRIRNEKEEKLSEYHRNLKKWSENVDRRYAWVALLAQWLVMFAALGVYRIYGLIFAIVTEEGYYTREEATWPVSMIVTVQSLSGPMVSIFVYHISFRLGISIGGILLVLGNALTAFSSSLVMDTILLGIIQGVGQGFIFTPFLEINNNYFLKYRRIALGIALCGGTMSVFILEPIFKRLLEEYPWRCSYLALGGLCCMIPLSAALLKPNPRPRRPISSGASITAGDCENPPKAINQTSKPLSRQFSSLSSMQSSIREEAQAVSVNQDSKFKASLIWTVLKVPAFHIIWLHELLFYVIFYSYGLSIVDYGVDRGCTLDEAESLLRFQSVGEVVGRIFLAALIDRGLIKQKYATVLSFILLSSFLTIITQVNGYLPMAAVTAGLFSVITLLYVLLNGLLVEHLGEKQVTLGYGMASFISGTLMVFRPHLIGFFRDHLGSYDLLMLSLAVSCAFNAILWMLEPLITRMLVKRRDDSQQEVTSVKN